MLKVPTKIYLKYGFREQFLDLLPCVVASIVSVTITLIINSLIPNYFVGSFVDFFVCFISYFAIVLLFKGKQFMILIRRFKAGSKM